MLQEKLPSLFEKVIIVAGARPNFIKVAPLCIELRQRGIPYEVFYSGQHYDHELYDVFKKDLGLDDGHLAKITMTGNSIKDIQKIMGAFHSYLKKQSNVTCVIVVGDVNTTYACSIVTKRFDGIRLAHLESGLRSFDQSMPEEMNRMTVDHLSDIHLAPSEDAVINLKDEGITGNVHLVGNIMIDSLIRCLKQTKKDDTKKSPYCVITFHRQENVDNKEVLEKILDQLISVSKKYKVFFPVHPRTLAKIEEFGFENKLSQLSVSKPLSYINFLKIVVNAEFVLTDSGGIQEETSYLGIPCFTVRKNTERPVTIRLGTNKLIGYMDIESEVNSMGEKKVRKPIPYWDGNTAKRIVDLLNKQLFFI